MEKIIVESENMTSLNVEKIGALFPNCITEARGEDGKLKKAINFDTLRQMLSEDVIEGKESYEFTWVGKNQSIVEATHPIQKTLRPCPEESVNWDSTENLYIEGDNLQVLKLLQKAYIGKIKMIYIDPPYNTGNDFVYNDDFSWSADEWDAKSGRIDDEGNHLFKNTESNGRFHSDWCSMMYSRLLVAQTLLQDDGVIFISIDDNEQENLKKMCCEVFGPENFVAELIWEKAYSPKNDAKYISESHDYVLMFAKNINHFTIGRLPRTEEANARYRNIDNDPRGPWKPGDISVKTYNVATDYPITTPSGRVVTPPAGGCWRYNKETFESMVKDNRIYFGSDGSSVPSVKRFLSELRFDGMAPTSILFYKEVGHSQEGAKEVSTLMDTAVFDGPKPVRLLDRLLTLANLNDHSIVLDFFSGSASTAHAVMKFNAINNKHIMFIMCQVQETCHEGTKAHKANYKNICEIGKERIRRAGKKIKEENPLAELDVGFRVLKLDDWNKKDVERTPADITQADLLKFTDNLRDDRSGLDLFFGCLIDSGLELTKPITSEDIEGCTVYSYNEGWLVGCFAENVPESVIQQIAAKKPRKAVFRDSSFADSPAKINVTEIFKMISPDTQLKVI